ncbi:MAG: pyridoxamine 5'-phosphate oxidase [Alphaproteobacteria bacterium]|nr:pyridoxamine 5'-phosphate oxidase [Alphaproteobacteria bacterium]
MTDPFDLFTLWFKEACLREESYPDAMCVSTVSKEGQPSSRQVLLKHYSHEGFVFFTNTQSRKGKDIADNPNVALNFYWKSIKRQIRIEGEAHRVSDALANEYFITRPGESKIGAWASKQSKILPSRDELDQAISFYAAEFQDEPITRPPHWSGYCIVPKLFEFWTELPFRLHDRTVFQKDSDGWQTFKLYP